MTISDVGPLTAQDEGERARKRTWYRPGISDYARVLGALALLYVVVLTVLFTHEANGYWHLVRATGFIVYVLLSISVALGVALSARWKAYGRPWLIIERLHPLALLAGLAFLSLHIVGLLLLNFSLPEALIPGKTGFRTVHVGLGIISMYLWIALILSTHLMRYIGFKTWRVLHYLAFVVWILALGHGIRTGHDTGQSWASAIYAAGGILVIGSTLLWILSSIVRRRPAVQVAAAE